MSNLVKPGYRSDHSLHSAVILEVKFNFVQRGKSQWKLKKKKTPVYSMINSTCIFKSYTKKKNRFVHSLHTSFSSNDIN